MAYNKTNWKDTIKDASGNVIERGTPLAAQHLNKMEDGIEDAHDLIDGIKVIRHREEFVSAEGQDTFTLENEYDMLRNRVDVTVGGVPQYSPAHFTELTNNSIKLAEPLPAGIDVVITYFGKATPLDHDVDNVLDNHSERLNTSEAKISSISQQLAENVERNNTESVNVKFPPSPLTPLIGDGRDETESLQQIIDYCLSESRGVFFPEGVYGFANIDFKRGLRVQGVGREKVMLKHVGEGVAVRVYPLTHISDVEFRVNQNTQYALDCSGASNAVCNTISISGEDGTYHGTAVRISDEIRPSSYYMSFENVYMYNLHTGFSLGLSANSNRFYNIRTRRVLFPLDFNHENNNNNLFVGLTLENFTTGIKFNGRNHFLIGVRLENATNDFVGTGTGIVVEGGYGKYIFGTHYQGLQSDYVDNTSIKDTIQLSSFLNMGGRSVESPNLYLGQNGSLPTRIEDGLVTFFKEGPVPHKGLYFRDVTWRQVQPIHSSSTAGRPTGVRTGYTFFDTNLKKPIWWDGSKWIDSTGSPV